MEEQNQNNTSTEEKLKKMRYDVTDEEKCKDIACKLVDYIKNNS